MNEEIKRAVKKFKPGLPEETHNGITEIIKSHIENKDANQNTIGMSMYILTRVAESYPKLKFSTEKTSISRKRVATFSVDFDIEEYAIVADPYIMIENALINDCLAMIEKDIKNTNATTLTSQALIFDITQVTIPRPQFTVNLQYGLK